MFRIIAGAGLVAFFMCAAPGEELDARAESGQDNWSNRISMGRSIDKTIESWPARARASARVTIDNYGRPDDVGENALVWYAKGPWKKTIVYRRAWPRYAFKKDKDYVENTIGYDATYDQLKKLALFDNKLAVNQATAELSSRSESEAMNYLALNLADEIVQGHRTVKEAREFYVKTIRLAAAGKSSPYLSGLMFDVHNDASSNPWSRR